MKAMVCKGAHMVNLPQGGAEWTFGDPSNRCKIANSGRAGGGDICEVWLAGGAGHLYVWL